MNHYQQLLDEIRLRLRAWQADEIAALRAQNAEMAHDCRLRAAVLEQLAKDSGIAL